MHTGTDDEHPETPRRQREAGDWCALRMPRHLGLDVVRWIPRLGSVMVDPAERALYFFTAADAVTAWRPIPNVLVVSRDAVRLPAVHRLRPPGLYWLGAPCVPPRMTGARQILSAVAWGNARWVSARRLPAEVTCLARTALVFDTASRRFGQVMAGDRDIVWLRPLEGGEEWHAPRVSVLPASLADARGLCASEVVTDA
ncbi:hypothetical protein [Streptomyces sp. MI02-7b]|uniref:hypothetical protein n=1 Tax=Streptomyces sp. MI02-7b TaxID=462941 RepID=UPI0029A2040C|nr:hypothetical protein [Streptomyces sp. MI02-7b]MDX3075819.1 hypothetical protein [Streptomyces sp. MI02-7b]